MDRQSFDREDIYASTLEYFKGDELATKVWITKYALKDSYGNIYEKTPADMHWRLAKEIARIEKKYASPLSEKELFDLFDHFRYLIPQGSPMTGIGNDFQIASLSNCFVIGEELEKSDSYGAIIKTDEEQIQLMKRRGGVGHDLSGIRPKGSPVKNAALTSTGIVPFMERYSNSTKEVAQDGRRGALMLSISIQHPDATDFIDAKTEMGKITGANISVRIDDAFMKAALGNENYTQQFPIESANPQYTKEINAAELWKKIIHNAWQSAEPGVLFWDTIIRESLPDCYSDQGFRTISTNPCGEIPLCPYDSCRLLALNLYSYVNNPFTPEAHFDFDLFKKHVALAQRIMDDIIDLEIEKIDAILAKIASDPEDEAVKRCEREVWEKIREKSQKGRRTGIGITAEGDMLAAMNLRYGSEEACEFAEKVHQNLAVAAYLSSAQLAEERGAFPVYNAEKEKNNPFLNRLFEVSPELREAVAKKGRRNIACLTIAPTGTTSLMSQTTSGIEPAFMLVYKRRRKINATEDAKTYDFIDENGEKWEEFIVFHEKFKVWMQAQGLDTEKSYSQEELNELIARSPYHGATSKDVDWLQKVRMQGRIQKWVDHSISVTINLPNDVSEDLVNTLYIEAWKCGCKGCTVYRDGSRAGVLVDATTPSKTKEEAPIPAAITLVRPKELEADVLRFQNNKEKWIAFIGLQNGRPYEIFTGIQDDDDGIALPKNVTHGKIIKNVDENGKRYDFQFSNRRGYKTTVEGLSDKFNPEYWNYAKLISGVLRYGMPIDQVLKLVGSLELDSRSINTWKNGVERALKNYLPDGIIKGEVCPNCGGQLVKQEGCTHCSNCEYSKCG